MDSQFLLNLQEITIQSIIIALIVFALTMLIKWPIKKATSNLEENKRKAANTVIIFIPIILAFIISVIYYGVFDDLWFKTIAFDTAASSYILSITIYAIFSRIVILIKGTKSNCATNQNLSTETISYLKQNIKTISKALKIEQSNLDNVIAKTEALISIRNNILNSSNTQNISQVESINKQINELQTQKQNLNNSITAKQVEIENFKTLTQRS